MCAGSGSNPAYEDAPSTRLFHCSSARSSSRRVRVQLLAELHGASGSGRIGVERRILQGPRHGRDLCLQLLDLRFRSRRASLHVALRSPLLFVFRLTAPRLLLLVHSPQRFRLLGVDARGMLTLLARDFPFGETARKSVT